jgi:hypothetical protein
MKSHKIKKGEWKATLIIKNEASFLLFSKKTNSSPLLDRSQLFFSKAPSQNST